MKFDGQVKTLEDLMMLDSGFAFKSSEWVETGTPVIKIRNVQDGYVDLSGCSFVSDETAKKASSWYGEIGNTLIALTGAGVGEIGRIRDKQSGLINQRVGWVRSKDSEEEDYIYYLLRYFKTEIIDLASGSAQPNVSPKDILRIPCQVPLKVERVAVGAILSVLDEKIALNNLISTTLEDIAQTLFKSWFIDFDPVMAKIAGEKPAGMDAATAALFPDSMEESELGLIPKGWNAGTIGAICDSVVNGSTPLRTNSAFWSSDDISWFKTGELSDNFLFDSKELITQLALDKTSVKVLPRGSVLMAIYAAPTVGRLGILTKSATFNQACTGMVAKNKFGTPYLYLTLFNRRFWFNSLAIGAAQQNISKVIVEGCPAITASQDVHNAFLEITKPIFAQIETLGSQSNSLALIRDSILPRLISGELQIPGEMLAS
jgi:type I restriction enzyme S subunit